MIKVKRRSRTLLRRFHVDIVVPNEYARIIQSYYAYDFLEDVSPENATEDQVLHANAMARHAMQRCFNIREDYLKDKPNLYPKDTSFGSSEHIDYSAYGCKYPCFGVETKP